MCPNTEFFLVRIQSESGKIRTRKNSAFGHFSDSVLSNSDICRPVIHNGKSQRLLKGPRVVTMLLSILAEQSLASTSTPWEASWFIGPQKNDR